MLNILGAVWAGAVRTVPCPRCRLGQSVARRPMPFEATCRGCRRRFRVVAHGSVAVGAAEVGRPR